MFLSKGGNDLIYELHFFHIFFIQVQIEIIKIFNINDIFEKDFIMIESDVYFESYRHVYGVLKAFTLDTFPMKSYIVDADVSPIPNISINSHTIKIFNFIIQR